MAAIATPELHSLPNSTEYNNNNKVEEKSDVNSGSTSRRGSKNCLEPNDCEQTTQHIQNEKNSESTDSLDDGGGEGSPIDGLELEDIIQKQELLHHILNEVLERERKKIEDSKINLINKHSKLKEMELKLNIKEAKLKKEELKLRDVEIDLMQKEKDYTFREKIVAQRELTLQLAKELQTTNKEIGVDDTKPRKRKSPSSSMRRKFFDPEEERMELRKEKDKVETKSESSKPQSDSSSRPKSEIEEANNETETAPGNDSKAVDPIEPVVKTAEKKQEQEDEKVSDSNGKKALVLFFKTPEMEAAENETELLKQLPFYKDMIVPEKERNEDSHKEFSKQPESQTQPTKPEQNEIETPTTDTEQAANGTKDNFDIRKELELDSDSEVEPVKEPPKKLKEPKQEKESKKGKSAKKSYKNKKEEELNSNSEQQKRESVQNKGKEPEQNADDTKKEVDAEPKPKVHHSEEELKEMFQKIEDNQPFVDKILLARAELTDLKREIVEDIKKERQTIKRRERQIGEVKSSLADNTTFARGMEARARDSHEKLLMERLHQMLKEHRDVMDEMSSMAEKSSSSLDNMEKIVTSDVNIDKVYLVVGRDIDIHKKYESAYEITQFKFLKTCLDKSKFSLHELRDSQKDVDSCLARMVTYLAVYREYLGRNLQMSEKEIRNLPVDKTTEIFCQLTKMFMTNDHRLFCKLKKNEKAKKLESKNVVVQRKAEEVEGYEGDKPIDELLNSLGEGPDEQKPKEKMRKKKKKKY